MGLPGILMFTRSTVTNSIKTNTSLMLFIKKPFDCMEIRFLLFVKKLDALENDFFPFGAREAFESMEHLCWHAIAVPMRERERREKFWSTKSHFSTHDTMHISRTTRFNLHFKRLSRSTHGRHKFSTLFAIVVNCTCKLLGCF